MYTEIAKHPHVDSSATPLETLIRKGQLQRHACFKIARDVEPCQRRRAL
jgi:hypothetical protein